jgi:DNA-binding MarR family transcriptional regulator
MHYLSRRLGERLCALAEGIVDSTGSSSSGRQARRILSIIAERQPVALKPVAELLGRPLPAVSRAVDALVRAGLVSRIEAPDDRRRLALSLTDAGRAQLAAGTGDHAPVSTQLDRLAQSELRAVERAVEILERGLT